MQCCRDTYWWSLVRVEHRRALEHVLSVREALAEPAGRMRRRQSLPSRCAVASERLEIAPCTLGRRQSRHSPLAGGHYIAVGHLSGGSR